MREDDANRLPAELMRRYEVVVVPRAKHAPIALRDVSAAHIGKLVRVQARSRTRYGNLRRAAQVVAATRN